jgi:hypothetical protein
MSEATPSTLKNTTSSPRAQTTLQDSLVSKSKLPGSAGTLGTSGRGRGKTLKKHGTDTMGVGASALSVLASRKDQAFPEGALSYRTPRTRASLKIPPPIPPRVTSKTLLQERTTAATEEAEQNQLDVSMGAEMDTPAQES